MTPTLTAIILSLASTFAHAADLLSDAPYGMNMALLAPWQAADEAPNTISVSATCVNLLALDSTTVNVSIYGVGYFTFTGTKTVGDGVLTADSWYGTGGTNGVNTLAMNRDGEKLTADMSLNGRKFQVARIDSTCAGALIELTQTITLLPRADTP